MRKGMNKIYINPSTRGQKTKNCHLEHPVEIAITFTKDLVQKINWLFKQSGAVVHFRNRRFEIFALEKNISVFNADLWMLTLTGDFMHLKYYLVPNYEDSGSNVRSSSRRRRIRIQGLPTIVSLARCFQNVFSAVVAHPKVHCT